MLDINIIKSGQSFIFESKLLIYDGEWVGKLIQTLLFLSLGSVSATDTLSFIINPLEKGKGKNNTLLSRFVSNQVLEINQHKVEDVIMEHTGDICVLEWYGYTALTLARNLNVGVGNAPVIFSFLLSPNRILSYNLSWNDRSNKRLLCWFFCWLLLFCSR